MSGETKADFYEPLEWVCPECESYNDFSESKEENRKWVIWCNVCDYAEEAGYSRPSKVRKKI